MGFAVEGLMITGEYNDLTAESVRLMQAALGVEQDGHCGPATRAALKEQRGINLDAIPYTDGAAKTHWFGEGADPENGSIWPPDEVTQAAPEAVEEPTST
jgi:peptidoglycan hydrolase-like protein with peptidoglycan-binding domain